MDIPQRPWDHVTPTPVVGRPVIIWSLVGVIAGLLIGLQLCSPHESQDQALARCKATASRLGPDRDFPLGLVAVDPNNLPPSLAGVDLSHLDAGANVTPAGRTLYAAYGCAFYDPAETPSTR